ncbi:hypothetical protein ACGFX2_20700 [Streptomyces goshikiensis]|uniref:hypothetical protein n=1 Tax=Streptomyces goshikiensis TaxID=1942 RepID=UPI0037119E8A
MAEIPGARAGLPRDAEEVRAYRRSLAARVARDARPERAAYGPALASRAAESLRADGWESRVEAAKHPRPGGWEVVVAGVRDGRRITLSFPREHDVVLYRHQ